MNRRAIAAAAVSVCVLLSGGCSAKKSGNKVKKAEKPTEWSVGQRSLDDVVTAPNEDNVYVKRDEEGDKAVRLIHGLLGDGPVNDENDALDLIASYSQEMGFTDVYSELKFTEAVDYGDRKDFRFDQYFGDKEIIGSYVELTVDKRDGNKPIIINSTYSDMWNFDSKPKVTSAVAVQCAGDRYKVAKGTKPELAIYCGPVLVWIVPVVNDKINTVYVDATNGNIIHRELSV